MNSARVTALFLLALSGSIRDAAPTLNGRTLTIPRKASELQSTGQTGYAGRVLSIAFSPDGKIIVAIGDLEDRIKLWDTTSGEELRAPEGLTDGVYCIAFSPDGKLIAGGLAIYGRRPRVWDTASGKLLRSFSDLRDIHPDVHSVAFSPDGKTIASGNEKEIGIWDVATGNQLRSLLGHSGNIHSLAFSPDGKVLASGGEDETIKLWDAATGKQLHSLNNGWVTSLAFSPNGKELVSNAKGNIKLWDISNGNELRSIKVESGASSVAFAPDGKLIASAGGDGTIKIWDVESGAQLRTLSGHAARVNSVAFSPDGKMIASGSDDHTIRLWDAVTGVQIRLLGGPVPSSDSPAQSEEEGAGKNWRQHPKIIPIRKLVNSINAGLQRGTFKTAQRKFNCEEVPYFTLLRIARNAKGAVTWYENYQEGEDSSWDYFHYYDQTGRLSFVLIKDYAANGSREEFRFYFDESGKLIRKSRKLLKGPGYFSPQDVEELVKLDPAKEFEAQPAKNAGCKEVGPRPKRHIKNR